MTAWVGPNPSGICWCGCGQITKRANRHQTASGQRKGDYSRYCHGHAGSAAAAAKSGTYWIEQDGPLDTPCWVWQGALNSRGYASRKIKPQPTFQVHVRNLEIHLGRPLRDGHQAHHVCRIKACVNPLHLQELTPLQHKHAHMREVAA